MGDDPFWAVCVAFEDFLQDEQDIRHWQYVLQQYESGRFSTQVLIETMRSFRNNPPSATASTATDWEHVDDSWSTAGETKGAGKQAWSEQDFPPGFGYQSGKGKGKFPPGGKGDRKFRPGGKGNGKFQQRGKGDGEFREGGKGDGKFGWEPHKGDGKYSKGGKGDGKGGKGGGKKGGYQRREITAVNLADAQRRMDLWLRQHPKFIFRPREEVPPEFKPVYEELGEDGPHLWKNLRHHMAGERKLATAGRFLQFLAENSTWKVAKNSVLERDRRLRKEKDAMSSKLSGVSGWTGWSRRTFRR